MNEILCVCFAIIQECGLCSLNLFRSFLSIFFLTAVAPSFSQFRANLLTNECTNQTKQQQQKTYSIQMYIAVSFLFSRSNRRKQYHVRYIPFSE